MKLALGRLGVLGVLVLFGACAHGHPTGGGGGGASGATSGPVPAGVRTAAEAMLGKGVTIKDEHEDGKTIYEASAPTKVEIELTDTGALQKTEVAIPLAALPAVVRATATAKGTPSEAEVVLTTTGVTFEVEVKSASGELELTIDAAGTVLATETESGDDKD